MGFRARQVLVLTLVAVAVAVATSLWGAAALTRQALSRTKDAAELIAAVFRDQVRQTLDRGGVRPELATLATDPELRGYAEAVVGYSPITLYLAVLDGNGMASFHSDPRQRGTRPSPVEEFESFSQRSSLEALWILTRGRRVLAVDLPVGSAIAPGEATVRVALSSVLLREQLVTAIGGSAMLAAGVVLLVFGGSFYLANRLVAPIEALRRELTRIDTGESEPPLDLRTPADASRVAEFFVSLSRQVAASRERSTVVERRFESLMRGVGDAVIVCDRELRITAFNDAARRILGRDADAATGRKLCEIRPAGDGMVAAATEALVKGVAIGPRDGSVALDGRKATYFVTARPLAEGSATSGVLIVARDAEALSRFVSHLSSSQKLNALGQVASHVAHEIKNPLNALVLHLGLLGDKLGDEASAAQNHLIALKQSVGQLNRVVEGFLRYMRPERLKVESISIGTVFDRVGSMIAAQAEQRGIQLVSELAPDLPAVQGDQDLLEQALLNLVQNACEAMDQGGTLTLSASREPDDDLGVIVADTGSGIAPDRISRIFDLYFTTKADGNGIGLALTRRIVEMHGGAIRVESRSGEGTRFILRFPEMRA